MDVIVEDGQVDDFVTPALVKSEQRGKRFEQVQVANRYMQVLDVLNLLPSGRGVGLCGKDDRRMDTLAYASDDTAAKPALVASSCS